MPYSTSFDYKSLTGDTLKTLTTLNDLLFDKIILFITSGFVALAAADFFSRIFSDDVCSFGSVSGTTDQIAFAKVFCDQSIPVSQYIALFVLFHGILLGVVHYLWRSGFKADLSQFYHLANTLSGEEKDSLKVLSIVHKMEVEFRTYGKPMVYWGFLFKIFCQLLIVLASILIDIFIFNDFSPDFKCPTSLKNTINSTWPFPDFQVDCIYGPFKTLGVIRGFDFALLGLTLIFLVIELIWCLMVHTPELEHPRNSALFSFCTGMESCYFVSHSWWTYYGDLFRRLCSCKKGRWLPFIMSDMDFLLMLLHRTQRSLALNFYESQVYAEKKALQAVELQILATKEYNEKTPGKY